MVILSGCGGAVCCGAVVVVVKTKLRSLSVDVDLLGPGLTGDNETGCCCCCCCCVVVSSGPAALSTQGRSQGSHTRGWQHCK